jgi:hypothetical protein
MLVDGIQRIYYGWWMVANGYIMVDGIQRIYYGMVDGIQVQEVTTASQSKLGNVWI